MCLQVSDWETHWHPGWSLYHPSLYHNLGCLRSHLNTWHACATLYSAPTAHILQNAALETWQQSALSSLLGAQLSHLLPFLFTAQSSERTWLGWDVTWQLTLAVEERFLGGPHSSGEDRGHCVPRHDNMLIYNFRWLISGCSCGFVIRLIVLCYVDNAWFGDTNTFISESYKQAGGTISISVVGANCYSWISVPLTPCASLPGVQHLLQRRLRQTKRRGGSCGLLCRVWAGEEGGETGALPCGAGERWERKSRTL